MFDWPLYFVSIVVQTSLWGLIDMYLGLIYKTDFDSSAKNNTVDEFYGFFVKRTLKQFTSFLNFCKYQR